MKWKRQDIKLEVSDPKGVCLLFGCKGLPRTGHRKLGSRWATNISTRWSEVEESCVSEARWIALTKCLLWAMLKQPLHVEMD